MMNAKLQKIYTVKMFFLKNRIVDGNVIYEKDSRLHSEVKP